MKGQGKDHHRRTNRGAEEAAAHLPKSRKTIGLFVRATAKFCLGSRQQPKFKNNNFVVFIERKNGIHSVPRDEMKCQKSGLFGLIIRRGESDKAILNDTILYEYNANSFRSLIKHAVWSGYINIFSGCQNFFGQRWLGPL